MKTNLKLLFTNAKAGSLGVFFSLCVITPVTADPSSDGSGEIAIYTESIASDLLTTTDFTHDFDTNDREDVGSFTRSGSDITLNREGHYLAIYNARFNATTEIGSEERVEIQSSLTLDGIPLSTGWSQGFIRRQQGHLDAITSGMAIIEASANDVLQLHSVRTDDTTVGTVTRFPNETAIQLVKLDEVNMAYARLSLAAAQAGPIDATAVKVLYDTNDELDAGFSYLGGDLTLTDAGKYLVIANTYLDAVNNRIGFVQELTLDGLAISGTRTTVYLRNNQSTQEGTAAVGTIIETTAANQILSVMGELDGGSLAASTYVGGRCALTVVKLPSAAAGTVPLDPDFVRLSDDSLQDINVVSDLTFNTQVEVDPDFTHSAGSSAITVATGGDYLFLGSYYGADDGAARGLSNPGWSVNDVRLNRGQSGRYTRNTGPPEFGNTLGLVASNLGSNDEVKMVTRPLAAGGINVANPITVQGVRLASLFTPPLGFEIAVAPVALLTTEGGAVSTYDVAPGLAPVSGTVTVTISPDAQSEVSTDGTNFFPTLDLIFSDNTPQTVTVRAVDDLVIESVHSSVITHAITATGDPTNYPTSQPVPPVNNSITDNDVIPVNVADDAATVNVSEDTPATEAVLAPQGDLLANDTNGFNNFVSAFDSLSAFGAVVSVAPDGTFTYDPTTAPGAQLLAAGTTGVDTFSYTVQDADGNTDSGTVSITINGANDGPSASDDLLNDGPLENAVSYVSSTDLTVNDGIFNNVVTLYTLPAGSDLRLFPDKVVSQTPSVGVPPGGGVPENALDGDPGTFTHTDNDDNSINHTWQVDFGLEVSLEEITLTNRQDCCGDRLRDIIVKVLDENDVNIFTSATLNPANALGFIDGGGSLFVDFPPGLTGQTVIVERVVDELDTVANGSVLSLGEVTIIGSTPGVFTIVDEFLVASHDASTSAGAPGLWENVGSAGGSDADWLLGSGVTLNSSVASAHAQITGAYEWDGTTDATGYFVGTSINGIYGSALDQGDSAIEIWAKLDAADLTQISTLFETGGGSGVGLVVDNGILRVANGIDVGAVSYDLVNDPDGVLLGAATSEFFQVVMVMDLTGDRTLLYVNGTLVGTNVNGTGDWDGGDASGLGHFGGSNHGGFQNTAATTTYDTYFNGSMASFRVYSTALTGAQVAQNYRAVNSGTDIDGNTISVIGVVDGNESFVANGSPATLASGALVTMSNSSGGFEYHPNGVFNLAPGEIVTDTFTYRVSDGNGATAEAEVSVTITGVVSAVDDNLTTNEALDREFFANAIVGNDELGQATPGAFVELVPSNIAGGTWTNLGSAGTSKNATVFGSVFAPALESNFGALGAAVTRATITDFDGQTSTSDATIELWFKPSSGQIGKKTIFENGGNGNGFSIVFDPATNEVTATLDGGDDTTAIIQATATGVVLDEFNQFIVVIDLDGGAEVGVATGIFEDLMTVYLNNDPALPFNGTPADSGVNTQGIANDWCGIDDGALNGLNNTSAINENFPGMEGEVALFRVYPRILTPAEMELNYNVSVQPIISVSSPTTAQGATVTLNGDGSVNVDYSGVSLLPGASLMDSFTYAINDGAGGTSPATVNIVISGNSIQEDWRLLYFGDIANSGSGADSAVGPNGLTNLQNFALDLDPTTAGGTLDVDQGLGTIITLGPPRVWVDPLTNRIYLQHTRRADFASIPLTITTQFSRDLTIFENSGVPPTVIARGMGASGVPIEAVQTEFPLVLPVSGGKGRYSRVEVTTP